MKLDGLDCWNEIGAAGGPSFLSTQHYLYYLYGIHQLPLQDTDSLQIFHFNNFSQRSSLVCRVEKQTRKEALQIIQKLAIMKSFLLSLFYLISMMLTIITVCSLGELSGPSNKFLHSFYEDKNQSTIYRNNRKILLHGSCANRDISISQSKDSTSGIPQYIVQIINTCVSGCAPSDIHLHCGWFASARIVNPKAFKRLSYDDCLVNGGKPLKNSQIIRFTYSNSFMYPIVFKSAKFC